MKKISLVFLLLIGGFSIFGQALNDKWQSKIDEGKVLYKEGKYLSALEKFNEAKELIPTDTIAYSFIADCAFKTNNPDAVYKALEQSANIGYSTVKFYEQAISASRDLERDFEKAIRWAKKGLDLYPTNYKLSFELAMVYYEASDFSKSSETLRQTIAIQPKEEKAYFQLFHNLLEKENDIEAATELLNKAVAIFPTNGDLKKLEPDIYFKSNDLKKAESTLISLTELFPSDPKLFYNLALVYYNLEDFEKSVEMSNRALLINPEYYEALYNLGSFFYYMGLQYNLAVIDMNVNQYVHNNQGRNLEAAAKQYFEMAKPYFERASKLRPEQLDVYENLATIDVLLGNLNRMLEAPIPQTQMVQPDKVVNSERPLLFINELNFVYPNNGTELRKGEEAFVQFKVTNRGNKNAENLKVVLIQPVVISGLKFEKEVTIPNVTTGAEIEVKIPISFLDNDASTQGIEKFDFGTKKLRMFVQEPNGNNADLVEFEIKLANGPVFDEKVLVSGTMDISFKPNPKPRNFLLLLAVNDYKEWPDLKNPMSDIAAVKNVLLEKYNFDSYFTYELYENDFTHQNLRNELIKIKNEISPIDNLVIYYAGHGSYDPEFDLGAWIPYDASASSDVTYIQNSSLLKYLDGINSKHILLLIDACFSGSLFQGGQVSFSNVPNEDLNSRWAFSAGNLEVVSDGTDGEHSPFAKGMLEILEENNGNDLAMRDIISFVSFKVKNKTAQTPIGKPLNSSNHKGGEFVFHPKR